VFGVPRYKEMLYCNQMIMFYCNEAEVNDNFLFFAYSNLIKKTQVVSGCVCNPVPGSCNPLWGTA